MAQSQDTLISLPRLRIAVLALGESQHAGWWKCQFLSSVGLSFLSRLYPRSNLAAAVRSSTRAAKVVHDSSIGIGNVYHLFRLPQDIERRLDETLRDAEADLAAEFGPVLSQREQLLEKLVLLGESQSPPQAANGPVRMGTTRDIRRRDWASQVALAYYAAFRDGVKVFPYFEDEKTGR